LKNVNGNLEKFNQNNPCQICGDPLAHDHQWLYESERPSSPTAQFVFSLRDNGGLVINDPKEIQGRRFRFEEKMFKGGINPQTGSQGKDKRYFFVIGQVGYEPDEPQEAEANPQINSAQVASNSPVANTPVANGQPSQTDLLRILAQISDGKSALDLDVIRSEVKGNPHIFDNKSFFISVLNGMAFQEMVANGFATRDADNIFHSNV
jgi:hypothetical protein